MLPQSLHGSDKPIFNITQFVDFRVHGALKLKAKRPRYL